MSGTGFIGLRRRLQAAQATMTDGQIGRLQSNQPNRNKASEHPAWGADIERVFAIFQHAERGNLAVLYKLYDDLYDRDGTLQNQINVRRDAIASLDVDIQSGDPDDPRAEEIADAFRRVWKRLDWETLLRHHQFGPCFYGFAATEVEWGRGPDGTWDPMALHHVRPHAFKVAQPYNIEGHPAGALLVRTSNDYQSPAEYQLPEPERWIITEWDELRATASNGLMRASSILSVIKSSGLAVWIRLMKRHGLPFILATIESWADETAKATVRRAIAKLGDIPGIMVPKHAKATLESLKIPPVNSGAHTSFIEYFETSLAKIWNGAQLITEVGNSAGNYTVANNHRDARYALLAADKRRIERSWRTQLVLRWMDFNDICDVAAPRIDIGLAELQYATALIDLSKKLHEQGIEVEAAPLLALAGLRGKRTSSKGES